MTCTAIRIGMGMLVGAAFKQTVLGSGTCSVEKTESGSSVKMTGPLQCEKDDRSLLGVLGEPLSLESPKASVEVSPIRTKICSKDDLDGLGIEIFGKFTREELDTLDIDSNKFKKLLKGIKGLRLNKEVIPNYWAISGGVKLKAKVLSENLRPLVKLFAGFGDFDKCLKIGTCQRVFLTSFEEKIGGNSTPRVSTHMPIS